MRIILADDSQYIRTAYRRVLETQSHFEVVGVAEDGEEAADTVRVGLHCISVTVGHDQHRRHADVLSLELLFHCGFEEALELIDLVHGGGILSDSARVVTLVTS